VKTPVVTSKQVVGSRNKWLALAVLLIGAFMALLDTTIAAAHTSTSNRRTRRDRRDQPAEVSRSSIVTAASRRALVTNRI